MADAAYQANQDLTECIALKGFLILLVGSDPTDSKFPGGHCVCLDYISRKFSTITRSSFAAELRNSLEAAQAAVYYNTFLQENQSPEIDAQRLVQMQETGSLSTELITVGDNDGVFRAISAENPKTATEPLLTPHIRAYRDLLTRGQVTRIVWVDNRDMVADPLTKGKTTRNELNTVLDQGHWQVSNKAQVWPCKAIGA